MRIILTANLLLAAAFAQSPSAPALTFEVASIKAAPPPTDNRISVRMSTDAGRLTFTNVSLMNMLTAAYKVKEHQISGPAWLNSQRFDVSAKFPSGATKNDVPAMLQSLLADRFKLKLHKEPKVMMAYALVPAKGGPKLKEAEAPTESNRGVRMMMGPKGRHMSGKMSMQQLADTLSNSLDRPVVNMTELPGTYEIDLEWSGDEGPQSMREMRGPGPGPGGSPPGAGEHHDEAADAPTIFTALQEKLGLKLDPKKESVDILIVDNIERTPTEN